MKQYVPETRHWAPSLKEDLVVAGGPNAREGSPSLDTHFWRLLPPGWPGPSCPSEGPSASEGVRAAWRIKDNPRPSQASPGSSYWSPSWSDIQPNDRKAGGRLMLGAVSLFSLLFLTGDSHVLLAPWGQVTPFHLMSSLLVIPE